MKHEIEKQIEFLMEIDKSKGILRMNWMLDESRREDDAQHAWHACLTAMVLQKYAARPVDIGHVIQMLLVHDIVEIDAGDTYAYDEKGYESKPQREQAAADRIYGLLPGGQGQRCAHFGRNLKRAKPTMLNSPMLWTGPSLFGAIFTFKAACGRKTA